MRKVVLDASALLALLSAEKGAQVVQELLPGAVISTVNLAEVVTRLSAAGMPDTKIRETLSLLGLEIAVFNEEQAFLAGLLAAHILLASRLATGRALPWLKSRMHRRLRLTRHGMGWMLGLRSI